MPYANVERRRQFQREYKRKWRARRTKIHPLLGFQIYLCTRFPNLHVGGTSFHNGFLITNDATVQADVEKHDLFWKDIFPLALNFEITPRDPDEEE